MHVKYPLCLSITPEGYEQASTTIFHIRDSSHNDITARCITAPTPKLLNVPQMPECLYLKPPGTRTSLYRLNVNSSRPCK